jgi:hypothetical protein
MNPLIEINPILFGVSNHIQLPVNMLEVRILEVKEMSYVMVNIRLFGHVHPGNNITLIALFV